MIHTQKVRVVINYTRETKRYECSKQASRYLGSIVYLLPSLKLKSNHPYLCCKKGWYAPVPMHIIYIIYIYMHNMFVMYVMYNMYLRSYAYYVPSYVWMYVYTCILCLYYACVHTHVCIVYTCTYVIYNMHTSYKNGVK